MFWNARLCGWLTLWPSSTTKMNFGPKTVESKAKPNKLTEWLVFAVCILCVWVFFVHLRVHTHSLSLSLSRRRGKQDKTHKKDPKNHKHTAKVNSTPLEEKNRYAQRFVCPCAVSIFYLCLLLLHEHGH